MAFTPIIGEEGGEEEEAEIDSSILASFVDNQVPPDEAIISLAKHVFPDCKAITWIVNYLVIEFPKTDKQEFKDRLELLPSSTKDAPFHLRFHNGPLPNRVLITVGLRLGNIQNKPRGSVILGGFSLQLLYGKRQT
ncbi:hypothetical protein QBC33DRAFT_534666 [Phialemonium atrogriseum]|uniref:Uncharacterized protein n=1 Tax=Phialemonium atrogriseum TaxID=1093897 RepID=A0AAJ0C437_9PEZI|nr:uncharacterized protein QBC33DRAFT_534666 [Phialemonium atrogriseum]KAK1768349.1 hypothetical protein QBC33DRAFT_534666 [Phialemonium atrogriseum]